MGPPAQRAPPMAGPLEQALGAAKPGKAESAMPGGQPWALALQQQVERGGLLSVPSGRPRADEAVQAAWCCA